MSKQQPQSGLVPKLRFPEFREAGEWESELVKNLVATIAPPKKLTSDLYQSEGRFPVIDQSQEYICGWTNDEDALVSTDLPLIVFGDHTCALKFVNEPFVQGADGIKILKAHKKTDPAFLYQFLLFSPVRMESYKRHFSTLKEKLIAYPDKKTGEQQKIADCLSFLDALIAAQADKLDALKTHKKGLMQQLFPREGETIPRLRFPEFRGAWEWEVRQLGKIADVRDGTHDSPKFVTEGRPLVTSKNLLSDGSLDLQNVSLISEYDYEQINKRSKVDVGDILLGMIGTIGNPVLVKSDGYAIKNVALIKEKGELLNSYLVHLLGSQYIAEKFYTLNTGNTQKFIALGKIREIDVPVPKKIEQQKIADCFSSIDALIAAQADKLDALKTHKKGLMQQLFPSPEA